MSSINKKTENSPMTHNGAPAAVLTPEQSLRRTVLACMLWEKSFYEEGEDVFLRMNKLAKLVPHDVTAKLALEAREQYNLRHAPLALMLSAIRAGFKGSECAKAITNVIQRPDEMSEILSIYWKDGKRPIPNALRKGISNAFSKFNAYQLSKWDKNSATISIRDVMFLTHPKPTNVAQSELFSKIADNILETADTWESALSSGVDAKDAFTRLLLEEKLPAMALLKNIRLMSNSGVDHNLIRNGIMKMNAERILPFRFVAARNNTSSEFHDILEEKFLSSSTMSINGSLPGKTIILVDSSGSMSSPVSMKSDLSSCSAGAALAAICVEVCESAQVFPFNTELGEEVKARGFDLISKFQAHGGTRLGESIQQAIQIPHDRLIVITDEQSSDRICNPIAKNAYLINVSNCANGIGYGNGWVHIDGFSEAVVSYISEYERSLSHAV